MHLENSKNLGDNLLQFNFMRKACLQNRQLEIDYYCAQGHHSQLKPFIDAAWANQIRLHPWEAKPASAIDTWIAGGLLPGFYWNHPRRSIYNEFYWHWFGQLSNAMGIANPIRSPKEVALDHPLFDDFSPLWAWDFKDGIDGLIIDCAPCSGQFSFDRPAWEAAKQRWGQAGKRVVSVHDGIVTKFSLVQIGLLARLARTVVAVCTGPLHVAFNAKALATVGAWHIFHQSHTYSYTPQITAWRSNEGLQNISL